MRRPAKWTTATDYLNQLTPDQREWLMRFNREWEGEHDHAQATDGVTRTPVEHWDAPNTKTCPKCKQTLPSDRFSKSSRRHDGLASHCKECAYVMTLAWRRANKDKVKEYNRRTKQ